MENLIEPSVHLVIVYQKVIMVNDGNPWFFRPPLRDEIGSLRWGPLSRHLQWTLLLLLAQ